MKSDQSKAQQPSRRSFIRTGGVASAAVAAAMSTKGVVRGDEPASESKSDVINIGIVGAGGRGGGALNDSLSINENIKLIAVADLHRESGERVRKIMTDRHGESKVAIDDSKIYEGLDAYQKVLNDPAVDVVLLTTSPGFRPYHIAEAVKAGKHVFAEKPTCVDPAGYRVCLAAHEEAEKNGTAIVTGTQYRRQTNYMGVVQQIRDGAIGDIVSATTRYCSSGIWYKNRKEGVSDAEYQLNNWMHFIWLSGDQITEQAVHNIDTLNWVMDSAPESAYGSGGRFTRPDDSQMWDSMSIDYVYPGNRVLSFMCRQIPGAKGDNGSVIYGTKGTAYIGAMSSGSRIVDRSGNEVWSMKGSIADAYKQEHKDLIDSIRAGKPIVELKQTADSSLTAVMGRMAAYTGQEVTWDFVTKESTLDLFPKGLTWESSLPASPFAVPGSTKLV
ncbi:MAG: Gfo/Idh/MocA family oxidoreductase [Fuerstiella sp.]